MEVLEHIVNLDLEPEERWSFLKDWKSEIDELLSCYLKDFEGAEYIFDVIKEYKDILVPERYNREIDFVASLSKFSAEEVLVANLYYDILKSYFGCTAFAVDTGENLYHARNLDWHTENNLLSTHTSIFDFQKKGRTVFKSVGWKGFIGVLSGMKPHKFSITLNAILSGDAAEIAYPVSFLIRDVLENGESFAEAKKELETRTIASDCLLLLAGIKENEFAVIERTPKRFATREPLGNSIVVTNDYKKIEQTKNTDQENILSLTSCGRYDRAAHLLKQNKLIDIDVCLKILQDDSVQMGITVQQMIFDLRGGGVKVVKAGGKDF